MSLSLASLRRNYARAALDEKSIHKDPIAQFEQWFAEALEAEISEANAMTLATVDAKGAPNARIVLLKGITDGAFIFFSNYESSKGVELRKTPSAALVFHWPVLERQVRVRGKVKRVQKNVSAEYFASRPRDSQIGAHASQQSATAKNRAALEKSFERFRKLFEGGPVPLPKTWGGFSLEPSSIEFWQGRPNRLHDRIRYLRKANRWTRERLAP